MFIVQKIVCRLGVDGGQKDWQRDSMVFPLRFAMCGGDGIKCTSCALLHFMQFNVRACCPNDMQLGAAYHTYIWYTLTRGPICVAQRVLCLRRIWFSCGSDLCERRLCTICYTYIYLDVVIVESCFADLCTPLLYRKRFFCCLHFGSSKTGHRSILNECNFSY